MSQEKRHRKPIAATAHARKLRVDSTTPERVLWGMLRNRRLDGLKFRRQVSVGRYVVDFLCKEHNLVIELDGQSHDGQQQKDAQRTAYLESVGLRVIRVTNSDLTTNPEGVQRYILSQALGD